MSSSKGNRAHRLDRKTRKRDFSIVIIMYLWKQKSVLFCIFRVLPTLNLTTLDISIWR